MDGAVPWHMAWREGWRDKALRRSLWTGLAAVLPLVTVLPGFFELIAAKPGVVPPDPVLDLIPARNVAKEIFIVLYAAVLWGIVALMQRPAALARMLHAYGWLLALRMLTMYLVTFEPPPGIIPLVDPVTAVFYPGKEPFLKDLFFSGHTATPFLFALALGPGRARLVLSACAAVVGLLVVVQHVHYSLDVVAAPFFALLAWGLSGLSAGWCGLRPSVAAGA